MTTTLYVGNLPWSTNPETLKEAFAAHGEVVSARIITDKETGRSRGFGFVEVEEPDAEKMIAAMDGKDYQGRPLTVNIAKEKTRME